MVDSDALARAVERVGSTLEAAGMPRMAARVFAYVLAEDRDAYTARELAEGLDVSPAAISGAVRYLTDAHLVLRERSPRGRGDVFRIVDEDVWSTIMGAQLPMLEFFGAGARDAAALLDPGSAGRARMEETAAFFAFLREEYADLLDRWRTQRSATRA